jgi:ribokinase
MFDIISVGSAVLDVFLVSSSFPLDRTSVGGKIEVEKLFLSSGGGGTNTAAGFARLGLKTACIARLGDDLFGRFLLSDLEKENFDKKYLQVRKGDETDYSTILVAPNGSRTILIYRGQTRLGKEIFPWEALRQTRWLYLASLEGNVDLLTEVVEKAYENGVKIVLNPGNRELKKKEQLAALFPKLEALIVNREEAEMFGLESNLASFPKPAIIVITNGKQGAKLYSQNENYFAESFSGPSIDETGAGDGFSSGFVAGLVAGFPLKKALKLGMANGHSVVTQLGAKSGLLYESNITEWMEKILRIDQLK